MKSLKSSKSFAPLKEWGQIRGRNFQEQGKKLRKREVSSFILKYM